ncbi:MAG: RNA-binding S4 domain-containing protein [Burkholderiales bacterium]|uniref:RNA-binding S4 domain-containing protein n=1 Tax=Nitrosomonas sp. TaxID=42353 RepID=UPI001DF828BC|nr:RNA-binding S4 domain-containing protein [Nitrosomonas sp.]MCB1948100.1 RNA-binding S4 domain-containing protein [Nitrosomonas sp.]MCP5243983.1 RNA-binding S4 domain-containing protein [Burkholderiales bacterium]
MQKVNQTDTLEKFRLDKWLFAARFFKTRSLAAEAIERGRIHLNGTRVKPAKTLAVGDMLIIQIGNYKYEIKVLALSNKRGSAVIAQQLYSETEASLQQREIIAERLKVQPSPFYVRGRPTKRDRRKIMRLKDHL